MDDFVLQVKQIGQYPAASSVNAAGGDVLLLQQGGAGGAYLSLDPLLLFTTTLANGGWLQLAPGPAGGIAFNGAGLSFSSGAFQFTEPLHVPSLSSDGDIFVNGQALASQELLTGYFDQIIENSVWTFNGRKGNVQLQIEDVARAGAAPIVNPHFTGWVTAPTPWNLQAADDTVVTAHWVQQWAACSGNVVHTVNGRGGDVVLNASDISIALGTPGAYGYAVTPPMGDASGKIATTLFVDNAVEDLRSWTNDLFETKEQAALLAYAPLDSPHFTGIPTGPTASPGNTTGQLATTAFVMNQIAAATAGVASFNTRTGAVTLASADITGAGGALLASPAFTGGPTSTTPAPGDNSTRIATTAFVETALGSISAGVTSWNTRTGAVTLQAADVTAVGGALLASPTFTGTPAATTASPGDNTTRIATTAFVMAAVSGSTAGVTSFMGRTGAVSLISADVSAAGGALLTSPAFSGNPTGPTQAPGNSSTSLATTAFVAAAIAASVGGVASFNGRTGAVTLSSADLTGAGGALLASPTFTGTPAAPTATAGTNSTQLATTAFVQAALSAAPGGVSSFNSRTGAIVLNSGDVSAAGGALVASPVFTGNPQAPTPSAGNNSTSLATTAFVATALATAGGVNTWNGRAGAVTMTAADIIAATGACFTQSTSAPATGANNTFWFDQNGGQLYVQYKDPVSNALNWVQANTPAQSAQLGIFNGNCYLSLSGGNLLLSRVNGNQLFINGSNQTIPSAGVSLAPTALAATTLYYVYAFMSSGTMTLEASTTAYVQDATTGMLLKSGDVTRTLVGLARTAAAATWSTISTELMSYFNPQRKRSWNTNNTVALTGISSPTFQTVPQVSWVGLASRPVRLICWAGAYTSVSSASEPLDIGIDGSNTGLLDGIGGVASYGHVEGRQSSSSSYWNPLYADWSGNVADGRHYAGPIVWTSTGNITYPSTTISVEIMG